MATACKSSQNQTRLARATQEVDQEAEVSRLPPMGRPRRTQSRTDAVPARVDQRDPGTLRSVHDFRRIDAVRAGEGRRQTRLSCRLPAFRDLDGRQEATRSKKAGCSMTHIE